MKSILLLFVFILPSCISANRILISTTTPAIIEHEGYVVCVKTPCEVQLNIAENRLFYPWHWGRCNRRYNNLEAFPKNRSNGFVQFKKVLSKCVRFRNQPDIVRFDMQSTPGTTIKIKKRKK